MPLRLDQRDPGFERAFTGLVEARREEARDVRDAVAAILGRVQREGDLALVELTRRFDRLEADGV